ncbi:PH domain-containing protein [Bacillaceae bacterium Marseille-Q3522]|nr:PH domain-containing protein [Bacillaceae bacterium Marseille-Q3522]
MITQPTNRIADKALLAWRIAGMIYSIFPLLLSGSAITLSIIFDLPIWFIAAAIIFYFLYLYFFVFLFPVMRWKRWRYEVREEEIELEQGIFFIKKTLIPMIRVQHVDTQQGPILRKYQLATVVVSTAASTHTIPALNVAEAEELRHSISKLARVADEDE